MRPTVAVISTSAIEKNVRTLRAFLSASAPDTLFCAVVKANGYGHGASATTHAAIAGGASWLAVATLDEALEVAETADKVGSDAPVLILSELASTEILSSASKCSDRVRFTIASAAGVEALQSSIASRTVASHMVRRVHLSVDTGMGRMGVTETQLNSIIAALKHARELAHQNTSRYLQLEAVWTHLACAESCAESDESFTRLQHERFCDVLRLLQTAGIEYDLTHVLNSAGVLTSTGTSTSAGVLNPAGVLKPVNMSCIKPSLHHDMVRVGIAVYGVHPDIRLSGLVALEPAMRLISKVTALRTVEAGESVSYGRHWYARSPTRIATIPAGYADGIRRDSGSAGVEVLIRGERCPIVAVVTMDQMMVALPCGIADVVDVSDEVVIVGRQGADEITAHEVAERLGTIPYEVLVGVSSRVPRVYES